MGVESPLRVKKCFGTRQSDGCTTVWMSVLMCSHVWLFETPWTVAHQAPLSMDLPDKILEWVAMSSPRASSRPRDRTHVSCVAGRFFYHWATRKPGNTLSATELYAWRWLRVNFMGCEIDFSKWNLHLNREETHKANLVLALDKHLRR